MLSTSKIIGSIDREVRFLSANIDTCSARFAASHPEAGLTIRRVPERFVLQAKEFGVTLSFFRSRAGMDAGAEVVLTVWDGEVTFPGATPRHDRRATQVSVQQFRLTPCEDESWLWTDEATATTMTSLALADACIETVAERLLRSDTTLAPEQNL